tara:strand:+ start:9748 stop:9867 length:120 start_codon:yes stop_codon:yes gene_type:complete
MLSKRELAIEDRNKKNQCPIYFMKYHEKRFRPDKDLFIA